MSTLHDLLTDLAEETDQGSRATPPQDLWSSGRRWQRRRRLANVVVAAVACAGLIGVGALAWVREDAGELRPANAPAGLPDRVWKPSPTLPGTNSTGPLGRLAIVSTAERSGWWGSRFEPYGISAVTGEYAFLDLPRWADGSALTSDGTKVAYWVTGTPTGSPPAEGDAITGFAVYDAATGEVRVQEVPTEHTIRPHGLTWADSQTLVAEFTQQIGGRGDSDMDQSSASFQPLWVWRLENDQATPDPQLTKVLARFIKGGGGGLLWVPGDADDVVIAVVRDPSAGVRRLSLEYNGVSQTMAVDPSGTRAADIGGSKNPGPVQWVGPGDSAPRKVPESGHTYAALAWLDERTLLVHRTDPSRWDTDIEFEPGLSTMDVETGESREIVRPVAEVGPYGDYSGPILNRGLGVAWELATEPTFSATEPPDPIDRRLGLVLGVGVLVAAGLALRVWRRRVEP